MLKPGTVVAWRGGIAVVVAVPDRPGTLAINWWWPPVDTEQRGWKDAIDIHVYRKHNGGIADHVIASIPEDVEYWEKNALEVLGEVPDA